MSALPRSHRSILDRQPPVALRIDDEAVLPLQGLVLIATCRSAPALAAQVAAVDGVRTFAPEVCYLIDAGEGDGCSAPAQNGSPRISGIPGALLADLPQRHERSPHQLALVCIPRAEGAARERIEHLLVRLAIPYRIIPPLEDMLAEPAADRPVVAARALATPALRLGHAEGGSAYQAPPIIDLAALIGRAPHAIDRVAVGRLIRGKRILVTGAGGSIGAQLVHVAAEFAPAALLLMERSENALFEIDRQLARRRPEISRRAILHDVTDFEQTQRIVARERPDIIFHAAAHKHVPLMEDHPSHAITNNLFGTRSIAEAAKSAGVGRFVMISSDKAVNPTSIMGATKRLAELYVRALASTAANGDSTRFSMVRFGNVIGSACSVLTIWSAQLAEGGPITVTDPRMTRYFMTIPEAANLVIQSAAFESKSPVDAPVHVLDMGEPISITELARSFIRAHALTPRLVGESSAADSATMNIVFSGIRPGEKLHEELAYAAEMLMPSDHPGIRVWKGEARIAPDMNDRMIGMLGPGAIGPETSAKEAVEAIRAFVPEMRLSA